MRIPSSIPVTSGAIIDEIYANKEFFYVDRTMFLASGKWSGHKKPLSKHLPKCQTLQQN